MFEFDLSKTPRLFLYAYYGQLEKLQAIMKKMPNLLREKTSHGENLLHLAVIGGQLQTAQWLVSQDRNLIKQSNINGSDVTHIAAYHGQLEVIEWLSQKTDIKWHIANNTDTSPLLYAAQQGHIPVLRYLLYNTACFAGEANQSGHTALLKAINSGQLDTVRWLLQNGSEITEVDKYGSSAIHVAAGKDQTPIIEYLLMCGSNIDERNLNGSTPLIQAAYFGHLNTVKWLLDHGADKALVDVNGNTLLLAAVQGGSTQVMQWLLNNKVSQLCETNHSKHTPLMWAVYCGYANMARCLIDQYNTSLSTTDKLDYNALSHAALSANDDMLRFLCNHPNMTYRQLRQTKTFDNTPVHAHNMIASKVAAYEELIEQDDNPPKGTFFTVKNGTLSLRNQFYCPITRSLMIDPVIASDGHTYERTAMIQWLTEKNTSPMTGADLANKTLTPNQAIKEQLLEVMNELECLYREHRKLQHERRMEPPRELTRSESVTSFFHPTNKSTETRPSSNTSYRLIN